MNSSTNEDLDDFLDRINDVEKAMKDIQKGDFDKLSSELFSEIEEKSSNITSSASNHDAIIATKRQNIILKEQEERQLWWDRAFARNEASDIVADSDDEDTILHCDSHPLGESNIHGSVTSLKNRYNLDYTRWHRNWTESDPASISEEKELTKRKEDEEAKKFEESNPDFCNQFKADSAKRETDTRREISKSNASREQGNKAFSQRNYTEALNMYHISLKLTPFDSRVLANIAACHSSLVQLEKSIEFCDRAIFIDDKYAKAYRRRSHSRQLYGLCHLALKDALQVNILNKKSDMDVDSMKQMAVSKDEDKVYMLRFASMPDSVRNGLMSLNHYQLFVAILMFPDLAKLIRLSSYMPSIVQSLADAHDVNVLIHLLTISTCNDHCMKIDLVHKYDIMPVLCQLPLDLICHLYSNLTHQIDSTRATLRLNVFCYCFSSSFSSSVSDNMTSLKLCFSLLSACDNNYSLMQVTRLDWLSILVNYALSLIVNLMHDDDDVSASIDVFRLVMDVVSTQFNKHESFITANVIESVNNISSWTHSGTLNSSCIQQTISTIKSTRGNIMMTISDIISIVLSKIETNNKSTTMIEVLALDVSWLVCWLLSSCAEIKITLIDSDVATKMTRLAIECTKKKKKKKNLISLLFQCVSKFVDNKEVIQLISCTQLTLDLLMTAMSELLITSNSRDSVQSWQSIRSSLVRIIASITHGNASMAVSSNLMSVLLTCLPPSCIDLIGNGVTKDTVFMPYRINNDNRWTVVDGSDGRVAVDLNMCGNIAKCIINVINQVNNHSDKTSLLVRLVEDMSNGGGVEKLVSLFSNASQGPVRKNAGIALAKLALAHESMYNRLKELNGLQILQESEMQNLMA